MRLAVLFAILLVCAGQHEHHNHGAHDHSSHGQQSSSQGNAMQCPDAFESKECRDFIESDSALTVMHDLCSRVPFSVGCTLHRGCGHASDGSDRCFPANHLLAICLEFPDLDECSQFTEACGPLPSLGNCEGITDFELPTTADAYEAVRGMCDTHDMDGCDQCRETEADPVKNADDFADACMDPLGTLAAMCKVMNMIQCDDLKAWCRRDVAEDMTDLCPEESATSEGDIDSNQGTLLKAGDDQCIEDPTMARCSQYGYPRDSIEEDLLSLCVTDGESMPWMIGCSIRNSCKESGSHDGLCSPFTLLATLCADMPMMVGCRRYNSLCATDSLVQQCQEERAIPGAPTTVQTQQAIVDACSSHSMPACHQCPGTGARCPTTLETMSELCFTMPTMAFCSAHRRFCSATNNNFQKFCDPSDGDFLPPMRMYFHFGQRDVILFKSWVPESTAGYVGSFFIIVAVGIIVQAIKAYRAVLEHYWYKKAKNDGDCVTCIQEGDCEPGCEKECNDMCGKDTSSNARPQRLYRNLIRGCLTGRLHVKTLFRVGTFVCRCDVVTGVALGAAIFGYLTEPQTMNIPLAEQMIRPGMEKDGCCG